MAFWLSSISLNSAFKSGNLTCDLIGKSNTRSPTVPLITARVTVMSYLSLHASGRGHLELYCISSAHLRVPHKRQRDLALLRIDKPRVVILRCRFHLHSFGTHQRAKLASRILMPGRLPVVRLDQVFFARHQL